MANAAVYLSSILACAAYLGVGPLTAFKAELTAEAAAFPILSVAAWRPLGVWRCWSLRIFQPALPDGHFPPALSAGGKRGIVKAGVVEATGVDAWGVYCGRPRPLSFALLSIFVSAPRRQCDAFKILLPGR